MAIRNGKYSKLLIPLAHLYGLGVSVRNFLFNKKILKSKTYNIPIICIGNIAVGGTGKTPHVELILSLIAKTKRVAVISRGYKRKTTGMIMATNETSADDVGDEPQQIKRKFPHVRVIADANRRRAIEYLLELREEKRPDIILLDDGFQHRGITPSFSIILQDYSNPTKDDFLLPYGELRESPLARFRADCIIVTKCPEHMPPIEFSIIRRELNLYPHQKVFFSSIRYKTIEHISSMMPVEKNENTTHFKNIIILSGIANPTNMEDYLASKFNIYDHIEFPDHHNFSKKDIDYIEDILLQAKDEYSDTVIVTSEKDAVRLCKWQNYLSSDFLNSLYYLPIEVYIRNEKEAFEKMIITKACKLHKSIR